MKHFTKQNNSLHGKSTVLYILHKRKFFFWKNIAIGKSSVDSAIYASNRYQKSLLPKPVEIISWSDGILSWCGKILSWCEKILSRSDGILSWCDKILSRSDRILSWSDGILSWSEEVHSLSDEVDEILHVSCYYLDPIRYFPDLMRRYLALTRFYVFDLMRYFPGLTSHGLALAIGLYRLLCQM